jgi:hypothetical protein
MGYSVIPSEQTSTPQKTFSAQKKLRCVASSRQFRDDPTVMADDTPASPPRLVIARDSRLSSAELQRALSPPQSPGERGGALWQYGQAQKAKTFETDHFRVLYAKRRLRSPFFILLFVAATIAAIYLALNARWSGQKQLPMRFQSILILSSFTFAISAVLTLILAQLSVVRQTTLFFHVRTA